MRGPRPDFLQSHDNVAKRVRNLETGVHPTGIDVSIYADVPRTKMTDQSALLRGYTSGNLSFEPFYRKRAGMVAFGGEIAGPMRTIPESGEKYTTLPASVRPAATEDFIKPVVVSDAAGAVTYPMILVRVLANGEVWVFNRYGITSAIENNSDSRIFLTGIVYPAL